MIDSTAAIFEALWPPTRGVPFFLYLVRRSTDHGAVLRSALMGSWSIGVERSGRFGAGFRRGLPRRACGARGSERVEERPEQAEPMRMLLLEAT